MKKLIPLLVVALALSLSGCRLSASQAPKSVEPTLSDMQVQTQMSTLLTAQPTATAEAKKEATATHALPTPEKPLTKPTQAIIAATATPAATATLAAEVKPAEPTPTVLATVAPTVAGPAITLVAEVTKTPTAAATLSADDPKTRLGAATSTDPMNDSSKWVWPTGTNEFTSIGFSNSVLSLTSLKEKIGWRLTNPAGEAFGNMYLEAVVKTGTCAENDQYGLIVHVPVLKDANQGYLVGFTCDGRYSIRLWDGKVGANGQMTRLVDWTANKAINAGSNQTNRMGVMLVGGKIGIYANGVLLGEATNSSFGSGYFGLYVAGMKTANFTIQVDEMSYWENPKP